MIKAIHFNHPNPTIDLMRLVEGMPVENRLYTFSKDGVASQLGMNSKEQLEGYIEGLLQGNPQHPQDKTKWS